MPLILLAALPTFAEQPKVIKPKVIKQIRQVGPNHTEIVYQDYRKPKAAKPVQVAVTAPPAAVAAAPAPVAFQEYNLQAPRLEPVTPNANQSAVTWTQTHSPGPSAGRAANGYSLGNPTLMANNAVYGWNGYWGGYWGGGFYPGYPGYFPGGGCRPGLINQGNLFVPTTRLDPPPGAHPFSIYNYAPGPAFNGIMPQGAMPGYVPRCR